MNYSPLAARTLNGLAAAILFATALPSFAVDTPESLNGAVVVNADKAKELMGAGVRMIDMRTPDEVAEGHVKGAINVPYKERSKKTPDYDPKEDSFDLSKMPPDKNVPFIAYCNGVACWKSYKGINEALKAGYKKAYWFRGGYPEWKAKGYPIE